MPAIRKGLRSKYYVAQWKVLLLFRNVKSKITTCSRKNKFCTGVDLLQGKRSQNIPLGQLPGNEANNLSTNKPSQVRQAADQSNLRTRKVIHL